MPQGIVRLSNYHACGGLRTQSWSRVQVPDDHPRGLLDPPGCWPLTTGSHSPGLRCSPLQWIHDLEGCWWGRCHALAAQGLLQSPRSGVGMGGASCAGGHLAPSGGAAQGQSGNRLLGPAVSSGRISRSRREKRAMHHGQYQSHGALGLAGQTGRSYLSVHKKPWAPAGQMGAAPTRASTGSPGPQLDGRGPLTPECPQEALGPSWTDGGRSHPSVHAAC